jgi:ubiquinone/menaquinone biosynthesis C-methylase UbiE
MINITQSHKSEINAAVYLTDKAIEGYSNYSLMWEERYLLPKYFSNGSSVLDLACGLGRTTVRLHEMGYKVKGVDLSSVLVNAAKRRFPYIKFEIGNYCNINEQDASYDNILISYNGLDYAHPESERKKAIGDCARVLHEKGTLIFSSHNIKYILYGIFLSRSHKWFLLKNMGNGFLSHRYIYETFTKQWPYYASSEYIINQTESYGFRFKEIVGNRPFERLSRVLKKKALNRYLSPWLTYVFEKK